jgi:hypothetical protein
LHVGQDHELQLLVGPSRVVGGAVAVVDVPDGGPERAGKEAGMSGTGGATTPVWTVAAVLAMGSSKRVMNTN